MSSNDPLAGYLDDGPKVHLVGGPLDGGIHVSTSRTSFWSYLDDHGAKATREDFRRDPPSGYVHWCGRDLDTGDPLHAYVHGSAIAGWIKYADRRHKTTRSLD